MGIPNEAPQVLILVTFVLPGIVYQVVRSRLRGPTPDELDRTGRVLRATAMSTLLALVYFVIFGDSLLASADGDGWFAEHIRLSALLGVVLIFVVPTGIAVALQALHQAGWRSRRFEWLSTYDPTPTAWDHTFRHVEADWTFVRVWTVDGHWIGGRMTQDSYASSFPHARELFIGEQYTMHEDGSFGERMAATRGVYVRCDDVRLVEILRPAPERGPA